MYKVTDRQVGIAMFITILSLKLIIYPALVARFAQNDSYISVILSILIDFIFVVLTISIIKKHPDKNLKEMLDEGLGKILSKICLFLLLIYFLCKSVFAVKECHDFFFVLLYDDLDWLYFFIPILALAWFVMRKGLKAFSRTIEVCWILILFGLIGLMVPLSPNNACSIMLMLTALIIVQVLHRNRSKPVGLRK